MAKDLVAVEKTGAAPDRRALKRVLTPAQYGDLAEVPPELEWLANIGKLPLSSPVSQARRPRVNGFASSQ